MEFCIRIFINIFMVVQSVTGSFFKSVVGVGLCRLESTTEMLIFNRFFNFRIE